MAYLEKARNVKYLRCITTYNKAQGTLWEKTRLFLFGDLSDSLIGCDLYEFNIFSKILDEENRIKAIQRELTCLKFCHKIFSVLNSEILYIDIYIYIAEKLVC